MTATVGATGISIDSLARLDQHLLSRYVQPEKIAGCLTLVSRRGEIAHLSAMGSMDRERSKPMGIDTIFRFYSMSKPITSVALMQLHEQGMFQLTDPGQPFHPAVARPPGHGRRRLAQLQDEAGRPADDGPRSALAPERPDLRIHGGSARARLQQGRCLHSRDDGRPRPAVDG